MRSFLLAAFLLTSPAAFAAELMVMDGWARPTTRNGTAAYVTLHNTGQNSVTVSKFNSPVASAIEAHETIVDDDGTARMRPITPLTLEPDEMASFIPGGNHLMVMGLTQPLVDGEKLPLTITFTDGSSQALELDVQTGAPAS